MKTSSSFASIVVLLVFAVVASASTIPPGSILVSTRGNIAGVVALDLDGNVVGNFVPQEGLNTAGSAGLYDIIDVQQISPGGDILLGQHPYVATGGGNIVSRYDSDGNFIANVSGTLSGKYTAHLAIADPIDGTNTAYAEYNMGGLSLIDLTTNQVLANWTPTSSPRGIDVGPDGYVYMAVQNSGIWKVASDLSSFTIAVTDPQPKYADITFGPDGMLYASSYGNNQVLRYDVTAGTSEVFIAPSGTDYALDLCVGLLFHPTTGNLLVSSYRDSKILEFDGSTGDYVDVFASVAQGWNMSMAPVPEPSSLAMILLGAVSFVTMRRRRG